MTAAVDADPQPVPAVRTAPLRHREFRLLFWGQAVSVLGDRLVMVALPFAVLTVPGAGLGAVGLVLGANALALALCVLVGGVVADRLPRHRTMLASDVVRGLAQGATAALLLSGRATVPELVALQVAYGAAEAFFRPAALALVPQLVPPAAVQQANALLALSSNVGMIAGPAAAGVLVAVLGAGGALAVDALTFVISALTLLRLHPAAVVRRGQARGFRAELGGGWHEVRTRGWVWSVILSFSGYHALVLPAVFVLGPQVAASDRGGAAAWGVISAGFGSGAVLGSLLALRWRPRRPGLVIGLSLSVASAQSAVVVSPLPTPAVALLELVAGVAVAVCFTMWETALQQRIPADAQSRVSSFDYLGSLTLMPLGYLVVGPVATGAGTRPTAALASVVSLVVCLTVAVSPPVRRLRRLGPLSSPATSDRPATPDPPATSHPPVGSPDPGAR